MYADLPPTEICLIINVRNFVLCEIVWAIILNIDCRECCEFHRVRVIGTQENILFKVLRNVTYDRVEKIF